MEHPHREHGMAGGLAMEGTVPVISEYLFGNVSDRVSKGKAKVKEDVHMADITKGKGEYTIVTFEVLVILIVPLLQGIQPLHDLLSNQISCMTSEHQCSSILTAPLRPHFSPSQIAS